VFLGEPRTEQAAHAHRTRLGYAAADAGTAGGCVVIGFGAPWVVRALTPAIVIVTDLPAERVAAEMADVTGWLMPVVIVAGGVRVASWWRWSGCGALCCGTRGRRAVTWTRVRAADGAMQYTASSFAQPLTSLFHSLLRTRRQVSPGALATETPDVAREALFRPVFAVVEAGLARLRSGCNTSVHLYVLYIGAYVGGAVGLETTMNPASSSRSRSRWCCRRCCWV